MSSADGAPNSAGGAPARGVAEQTALETLRPRPDVSHQSRPGRFQRQLAVAEQLVAEPNP